MATVVLGAAATYALGTAAATVTGTIVTGLATAVGAYIDQAYLYPALFGDEGGKEPRYGSITVQTADEGSPIYATFGRGVRVPALLLFASEFREVPQTQRTGKRRAPAPSTFYVDVALGFGKSYPALEGGLSRIKAILADSKPVVDDRDPIVTETIYGAAGSGSSRRAGVIIDFQSGQDIEWRPGNTIAVVYRSNNIGFRTAPELGNIVTANLIGRSTITAPPPAVGQPPLVFDVAYEIQFSEPHGKRPGQGFMIRFESYGSFQRWAYVTADLTRPDVAYLAYTELPGYGLSASAPPPNAAGNRPLQPLSTANRQTPTIVNEPVRIATNIPDGDVIQNFQRYDVGESVDVEINGVNRTFVLDRDQITSIRGAADGIQVLRTGDTFANWWFVASDGDPIIITQPRIPYDLDVLENGASDVERTYEANGVAYQDPSIFLQSWLIGNAVPAFRDMATAQLQNVNVSSFGSRLPNFEAIIESSRDTIAEVIRDICVDSGLTDAQVDVSDLPSETVEGYRYSGIIDGGQKLKPLLLAYDIVVQQTDGKLRFFKRSDSTVISIDEGELIPTETGDRIVLRRREGQRPIRAMTVNFFDIDNNLEPGAWTEPASSDLSGEDRAVNVNAVMTADTAASIARRIIRDASYVSWEAQLSLPWTRAEIAENDILSVSVGDVDYRIRVQRVEVGEAMELVISGFTEPKLPESVVSAAAVTGADALSERIPARRWIDAQCWAGWDWESGEYYDGGIFCAASSLAVDGGFPGALVYVSADNRTTWRLAGSIGSKTVLGRVDLPVESLGTSTRGAWEPTRQLAVSVVDGELETIEEREVRGGGSNLALVGDEIVAFEEAERLEGGDYRLQGFLRGLYGSAAGNHFTRERFVLLTDAVQRIDLRPAELGGPLLVRIVPAGASIDEGTEFGFRIPDSGGGLRNRIKPANPVDVQGFSATASGDGVNLRWLPVEHDDLEYYEVRTGDNWMGARVVGRTTETTLHWTPPTTRSVRYQIRAKFRGGIWSPSVAAATLTISGLDNTAVVTEVVPVEGTVGGTGTGASEAAGAVTIDEGEYEAMWTQTALVADAVGTFYWDVDWEGYRTDTRTIDELPDIIPATFAGWHWTGEGTDGSEAFPGVGDWTTPADYPLAASEYTDVMGYGQPGTPGDQTEIHIQARWDENGDTSYGDWEDFAPGWRRAKAVQIRARMRRVADHFQHTITRLTAVARS